MRVVIIALVVLVFAAFLTTYTVRFTETAVVSTFGKAGEGSVKERPGLRLKIPYVQRVTKYDTRARFLESKAEQQQSRDDRQIIVTAFVTWRVADPLKFYTRFSGAGERADDHYKEAEKILASKLRSAMGAVSQYDLSQLLSASAGGSKLVDLEKQMLAELERTSAGEATLADEGIRPLVVAVTAIKLPQETTRAVFEAMKANRDRIATEASSQGMSQGETIRATAQSDARKIMAFADRLAQQIRAQGEREAAQYLARMDEKPELAVFMRNVQFLKEAFARRITIVLSTDMPGLGLLRPDLLGTLRPGELPSSGMDDLARFAPAPPASPINAEDGR